MKCMLSALVALFLNCTLLHADNWPAWRGPSGDGVSTERKLPLNWSATQNVRWKVALPEPCNSTPIVWGRHIFVTQGLDGGKRRALIALDRADGKKLWQKELPCDFLETSHRDNPPCSASPVTDGEAVYAWFASAGVVAYDFKGKQLWHRDLGPIKSRWGNGSSPILYKDSLIVFHGPGAPKSFLTALDKRTGKTLWTSQETAIDSPIFGCWSTPILARVSGREELILPLPGDRIKGDGYFKAYDPDTGKVLWTCEGLGNEIYAMPTINAKRDLVVAISGHNGPLLAVKPGGAGVVAPAWRQAGKNPQRVGSGVFHQGHFFLANATPPTIECLDAASGKTIFKERLEGNLWGSLLLADGRLYVSSLEGETFVLAAGPKFQLLARNKLGERLYAAPAVSNGEIFLRTHQNLYCIK
ncbi:MAG: PQQ-binding-like beta-propeller repeat protein [Planctomycetes bacterium]|nr:PQQ-binding-like beta-propeller repeat protein [Planctomycetota bacterium]